MSVFAKKIESLLELCGQTGKVEMSRYYEVLNKCDIVLRMAVQQTDDGRGLYIDEHDNLDNCVMAILKLTAALFENTFSRSVYSSFQVRLRSSWPFSALFRS